MAAERVRIDACAGAVGDYREPAMELVGAPLPTRLSPCGADGVQAADVRRRCRARW